MVLEPLLHLSSRLRQALRQQEMRPHLPMRCLIWAGMNLPARSSFRVWRCGLRESRLLRPALTWPRGRYGGSSRVVTKDRMCRQRWDGRRGGRDDFEVRDRSAAANLVLCPRAEENRCPLLIVTTRVCSLSLKRCGNINMLQTILEQAATVNSQKNSSAQPQLPLLVAQAQCGVYICSSPVSLISLSGTPILMPEPHLSGHHDGTDGTDGTHHKARQGWVRLNVTPTPSLGHARTQAIYFPHQIFGLHHEQTATQAGIITVISQQK